MTPWILLWGPVPRGILQAGIHAGERGYHLGIMGITHPVTNPLRFSITAKDFLPDDSIFVRFPHSARCDPCCSSQGTHRAEGRQRCNRYLRRFDRHQTSAVAETVIESPYAHEELLQCHLEVSHEGHGDTNDLSEPCLKQDIANTQGNP